MHTATSRQVVGHIMTIFSFSRERIPKIMTLSSMRLTAGHQSIARPKYVPISIHWLIYADLDVGFCKPIQHAGKRPIVVCHANSISRLG
jgi:hypothetical protein